MSEEMAGGRCAGPASATLICNQLGWTSAILGLALHFSMRKTGLAAGLMALGSEHFQAMA